MMDLHVGRFALVSLAAALRRATNILIHRSEKMRFIARGVGT